MQNNGPMETTMKLLQKAKKGKRMNILENYYIPFFQHNSTIIKKRSSLRANPPFQLAHDIQSRVTNIEPPIAHPH